MVVLKFICFMIYSLAIVVFLYYANLSYLYDIYKDWLFSDFKNKSAFDYIVVGAGSTGSVLATRLSNGGAKTLLFEAGGPPPYFFDIPVLNSRYLNTPYDWQYLTVPQKNACKGLNNNQSLWSAGKILGGSSRLNNMVYIRGHPDDYDSWFPDFEEPTIKNGGLLHVDDQNWHSELTTATLQGVAELSYKVHNINEASSAGFMKSHLTIKNGERWSTDKIMYENYNERLKILTHSFVTKILFKSNKAIGVQFLRHRKIYKAFAKKGVILCAGTVGSPKLLMLSGIGPKQHLEELNITTIVDLPVGQHLMDHLITGPDLVTINSNSAISLIDLLNPYSLLEYYLFKKGPWTSAGVDAVGTFHSQFSSNKTSIPDLEIMLIPVGLSQDNGELLRRNVGITDQVFNEYFAPLTYKTAITIGPVLLHPKSSGEIRLKSSNVFDPPIIDPKYLSQEDDVLTLIEGIKFVKQLVETKAMKKIGAELYKKPFPGCEHIIFDTIDYWKCYVRHLTLTSYHPVGTCRMGEVVDYRFRVYNTTNLYVVDASVFPKMPSGNIHGPVVMLSEKAARLLIEDFKKNIRKLHNCYPMNVFSLGNKCF